MLDSMRKLTEGWLAKVILALITIPFALFGIDSYLKNAGGDVAVAKIDEQKITLQEFSNALENVRNKLVSDGQKIEPGMLEQPAFKQSVLDGIISRRLVMADIQRQNFKISDEQLNEYILGMPEFQEKGKFSEDLYQKTLQQNKLTAAKFEASIRQDLAMQQARDGLSALAFAPKAVAEQTLKTAFEQREVTTVEIKAVDFAKDVSVTEDEIKDYYAKHKDKFIVPEKVKLEFALLSVAGIISQGQVTVTDDEVKQYYDANKDKFQGDEQRQASHILIGYGYGATEQDKADAKKKALDVLAQVKKNPKRFEDLAKQFSTDTGTAERGGDLGSFGRGMMVKPFEDAVFSMKPGQISDLVESEFGFHIIKLTGITGQAPSFDEVKPKIKAELLFQKAQMKYAELTEEFSNTVYEQSGSLKPVAEKFNIQLQTTPLLSKEEGAKFFKSDQLMKQAFSDEVLKEKRNSEAVEVAPNNLVSVRVVEYQPSAPRSFDEVKGGIESVLKLEKSIKLATEHGQHLLDQLKAGATDVKLDWVTPVTVDRKNAQGLTDGVMKNVFKIKTSTLPAYGGFVDENRAFVLIKVVNVSNQLAADEETKKMAEEEFQTVLGSEFINAYTSSLKAQEDIEVNTRVLFGTQVQ